MVQFHPAGLAVRKEKVMDEEDRWRLRLLLVDILDHIPLQYPYPKEERELLRQKIDQWHDQLY